MSSACGRVHHCVPHHPVRGEAEHLKRKPDAPSFRRCTTFFFLFIYHLSILRFLPPPWPRAPSSILTLLTHWMRCASFIVYSFIIPRHVMYRLSNDIPQDPQLPLRN
ncbi:hypothetical protein C8J57DRAFT_1391401 [Mycena rebaudengoi]|nr:hypothetical protein C8J57DRAFT_1391401 [Mycena rebaudengoi]